MIALLGTLVLLPVVLVGLLLGALRFGVGAVRALVDAAASHRFTTR